MSLSFIHGADPNMASYRYRAMIPAALLGASLNDLTADVLIFAKPTAPDLPDLLKAKADGKIVIVDCCDVHWQSLDIRTMIEEAHAVVANTPFMAQLLKEDLGIEASIIRDTYEYDERPPHCGGTKLLWFGHPVNAQSLCRVMGLAFTYDFTAVTRADSVQNFDAGRVFEWSREVLERELQRADIVLMPETAPHKSNNRTLEAVRQGCFVIAEPHPSLIGFPGIWIGNILKGILWAQEYPDQANALTAQAQAHVRTEYSPEHMVTAWKSLLPGFKSIWAVGANIGTAGSTSMDNTGARPPMSLPTSDQCHSTVT